MTQQNLDEILGKHRQEQADANPDTESRFFQTRRLEGQEPYFEVRFNNGVRTAFRYDKLGWFNYDPDAKVIDLSFDGTIVTISGRGLDGALFDGIKSQRIVWISEATTDLQDDKKFPLYIESITIEPPDWFGEENPGPEPKS